MSPQDEAGQIHDPHLRELYDYWSGKRGGRSWPAQSDILLEEIAALRPYILLVDVLDDGRHFRYRLIGGDVAFGIDPTGLLQHEAAPGGIYRDHVTALYRRGAAGPGALYSLSTYDYTEVQGPRAIGRLFMPLAMNGETVDTMLVGRISDRKDSGGQSVWQANPPTIAEAVEFRLP